jgi:hypothetical protein
MTRPTSCSRRRPARPRPAEPAACRRVARRLLPCCCSTARPGSRHASAKTAFAHGTVATAPAPLQHRRAMLPWRESPCAASFPRLTYPMPTHRGSPAAPRLPKPLAKPQQHAFWPPSSHANAPDEQSRWLQTMESYRHSKSVPSRLQGFELNGPESRAFGTLSNMNHKESAQQVGPNPAQQNWKL